MDPFQEAAGYAIEMANRCADGAEEKLREAGLAELAQKFSALRPEVFPAKVAGIIRDAETAGPLGREAAQAVKSAAWAAIAAADAMRMAGGG